MSPDADTPLDVVARWLRAVQRRDVDTAMSCVAEEVEVIATGNHSRGRDELRAWFMSSTATAEPLRWFVRDEHVVVETLMTSTPRNPEHDAPQLPVRGASHYTVRDGSITRIDYVAEPDEARRRAGLDEQLDQVGAPAS